MATNNQTKTTDIKGPADFGFIWAGVTRNMDNTARLAPTFFPGILDDKVAPELIVEFKKGALLRYCEGRKPVPLVKESGAYRPAKEGEKASVTLTVAYARSFAPHEVTKLKTSDAPLHLLVKAMRDAAGKDVSQQWARLVSRAKALLIPKDNAPRVAKTWREMVEESFEEAVTKAGKLREKALDAPSEDAIRKATVAFWLTLKRETTPKE